MRYTRRGLFVLFVGLAATVSRADELTTDGGKKLAGTLVAVDAEGVTFKAGDSEVKIPGKEILLIDLGNKVVAPAKGAKHADIELTDGSVVRCGKFAIKGKKFELELLPGPANVPPPGFELPLGAVFYAHRGADDPKARDEWKKMLLTRGKRDLYVIRQADGLNIVQGTVVEGGAAGDVVIFERENGTKEDLRLSRATGGLVFAQQSPAKVAPTLCKVSDVFGNTFFATAIEMNGSGMKVKTVGGVDVTYPSIKAVAKLDYSQGNIAYLSDLEPQVTAPDAPEDERLRATVIKDRTLANDPLKLDNVVYPKGLWVNTDTVLTFNIGGDYREFKAVVGIDDAIQNTTAAAKVTIEADGRVLFAETVARKDKPKGVTLDVKNVKQIRVLVESDTPFNGSQIIIADARVQK